MSLHSYTRCWIHLIWATLDRQRILNYEAKKKLSDYFYKYTKEKDIFMKINFVNPEHVHALIDLPTKYSGEEIMQLLKGSSSNWINKNSLLNTKFA